MGGIGEMTHREGGTDVKFTGIKLGIYQLPVF